MRKQLSTRRRRSETDRFRQALLRLRGDNDWHQDTLARTLGVSKRTLSNWECGYWLPPFKQRIHIVLSLRDVAPEIVLEVADGLGVSVDPAVASFLKPYRDALDPPAPPAEPGVAPALPPAPPPPPRMPTDAALLRRAVDVIVREAADGMNVSANELRAAIGRALATCAEIGGTVEEMREAVAVKEKTKGKALASPGPKATPAP
jgi:transcriptional regulator with XRE-family HTH domain